MIERMRGRIAASNRRSRARRGARQEARAKLRTEIAREDVRRRESRQGERQGSIQTTGELWSAIKWWVVLAGFMLVIGLPFGFVNGDWRWAMLSIPLVAGGVAAYFIDRARWLPDAAAIILNAVIVILAVVVEVSIIGAQWSHL